MQIKKLNTLYDIFKKFLKNSLKSAGLLMRFVIIITMIMLTSCAHEDITIETIRDDTTVAQADKGIDKEASKPVNEASPVTEESSSAPDKPPWRRCCGRGFPPREPR